MNRSMKVSIQKVFSTHRLVLNALDQDDAAFILALTNTEGWLEFIGDRNVHNTDQAKDYIEKIEKNPNAKYWKVSLLESQNAIGVVTLIKRDYLEGFDIGFAFLPSHTKRGYAYEATKVVLKEAIHQTEHPLIYAVTQSDNVLSIKLLKRLGLSWKTTLNIEGSDLEIYSISQDKFEIDTLTHRFFSVFSNKNGNTPNWDDIHKSCIPQVNIIRKQNLEQDVYDIEAFINPRKQMLSDGTLQDFEEFELEEDTKIAGNLAQRFSVYQKSGVLNKAPFKQRGNKIFQFIKTREGWKISSVVWEDQ